MSKWDDTVTIRFIKLYKDHECLWARQKNPATIGRRATAWCMIAKEVSKLLKQPVTIMDCKQKIKCLWQKFRREKLKVTAKGGDGISDWSLYGELTFLQNVIVSALKKNRKSPMPMLRTKRRTAMIQRYGRSTTNETLNKKRETNIVATPKCEVKETAKGPRNRFSTERKRKVTENIKQTLRCSNVEKLNTTENGKYSLTASAKRIKLTEMKKRPKYLNVNVIHNSTPEVHRPMTPVSVIPLDSCHTFAQDECQCFSSYVANKTRSYTAYTRSAVHHAISEILFKADTGYYDDVKSSATVNTQTDATESNVQQCPNRMQLSYVVKSEDLSDLDDDSVTALTTSRPDHVPIQ